MLTLKSNFSEFVDLCGKLGACEPAVKWMNAQIEKKKDLLFDEAMSTFLLDANAAESWSHWNIAVVGKELDVDVRNGFIAKITTPMMAMQLHLTCDFLTDEEDEILEAKFKGKLPTAEKELKTGIVCRAKAVKA